MTQKFILPLLFFISLSVLCAGQPTPPETKNGKVKMYHFESRQLHYTGQVKKHRREGNWTYWYADGKLMKTEFYSNGKLHGEVRVYDHDSLFASEHYEHGVLSGLQSYYSAPGVKNSEFLFSNGVVQRSKTWYVGTAFPEKEMVYENGSLVSEKTWYKNGMPKRLIRYKDNMLHGTCIYWDEVLYGDTFPTRRVDFRNNKMDGYYRKYRKNVLIEEKQMEAGKDHGTMKKWDHTGKLTYEAVYVNDVLHGLCQTYEKGILVSQGNFVNGEKTGLHEEFYPETGGPERQEWYSNSGRTDSVYKYYKNGRVLYKDRFIRTTDTATGKEVFTEHFEGWSPEGHITEQYTEIDHKRHGDFLTFYPDGRKQSVTRYDHGVVIGTPQAWHQNGQKKMELAYNKEKLITPASKAWNAKGTPVRFGTKEFARLLDAPRELIYNPGKFGIVPEPEPRFPNAVARDYEPGDDTDEIAPAREYNPETGITPPVIKEQPKEVPEIFDEYRANQSPRFPGKPAVALADYIQANMHYPAAEKGRGKRASVILEMVVQADGSITDITVKFGVTGSPAFGAEAVRIFRNMPKWIPARHEGKNVAARTTGIVVFPGE